MASIFNQDIAQELTGTHDLRLSAWGPYTKRYMGISHIPVIDGGLRFDLSLVPVHYGRKNFLPNVVTDCGYHPWKATADLSYFVHRHEMIWKDQLYADIAFLRVSEKQVFTQTSFFNNTNLPQNVGQSCLASIHFPPARAYSHEPLKTYEVALPDGGIWVDGIDYHRLMPRPKDPKDNLVSDGHLRGEAFRRPQGLVGGTGLELGPWEDDTVTYSIPDRHAGDTAAAVMRYNTYGKAVKLLVNGAAVDLPASDAFATLDFRLDGACSHTLTIVCKAGKVVIDGFAIVRHDQVSEVLFSPSRQSTVASRTVCGRTMRLKYEPIEDTYGIAWDDGPFHITHHSGDSMDAFFSHAKIEKAWNDNDADTHGRWTNLTIKPLFIEPGATLTRYGMIVNGSDAEVAAVLSNWECEKQSLPKRFADADRNAGQISCSPAGETYRFSQERMAATMLTNVVYPIRTRGTYIKHYTPGRCWDCLYTWDSGFVGLGLAELDLERSLDNLNAYVTEPGTGGAEGAAFLHHGTPLPVQIYQFLELWNRSQNKELAAYFYPRLRQFHRFLAGHDNGSTTRTLKSNLLRTWDYFYNSGGWDDYPAQSHIHSHRLKHCVTPVVNTAHVIRTARILKMIASELGEATAEYDADIAMFGEALQMHAWDEASGYFSYVLHDEKGNPAGPLMHESGLNFNMGLDGLSPLVAGICTAEQETAMVERLMTPGRIWSCCGLSTVDQCAAYYSDHGYWNGSVWMPHQWFMWKAMLSLGYGEEAWRIASTGLETWKREVEDSYNCYEVFNVKTGRGGGWHHFGGLSSPVLCWVHAYYKPGRLTVGLDTHVTRLETTDSSLVADLKQFGFARHKPVVLAVVEPDCKWTATFGDTHCEFIERVPGTLEISLPAADIDGQLRIQKGRSARVDS